LEHPKRGMSDNNEVIEDDKILMVFCYYCYKFLMENINLTFTWKRTETKQVINEAITLTKQNTDNIYEKYGFLLQSLLNENKNYVGIESNLPNNIVIDCNVNKDAFNADKNCGSFLQKKKKPYIDTLKEQIININKELFPTRTHLDSDTDDDIIGNIILVVILYSKRKYNLKNIIKETFKPFTEYDELIKPLKKLEDVKQFLNTLKTKYEKYIKDNNKDINDFFKNKNNELKKEIENLNSLPSFLNHVCIELRF